MLVFVTVFACEHVWPTSGLALRTRPFRLVLIGRRSRDAGYTMIGWLNQPMRSILACVGRACACARKREAGRDHTNCEEWKQCMKEMETLQPQCPCIILGLGFVHKRVPC